MAGRGYIKVDYEEKRSSHEVGGKNKQHCLDFPHTVNFRPAEQKYCFRIYQQPSHIVRQYHKQNE